MGPTAVVSGREIQRFFSPHIVLYRFVFYAADRGLPKELPEMRQVGLELTKLAANVAKITILAVSLVNIAILAASLANEENPSNFRVLTRTLRKSSW